MSEYKKYDSNDRYSICGVRIAKEPRVVDGEHGKMVSISFVSTSRKEKHKDIWIAANIQDFQADIASFLAKGDVLHEVAGKLVNRPWGDDNEKDSFELERASIVIPADLFAVLKDRGWEPGSPSKSNKPGAKGAKGAQGKGKPAAKGPQGKGAKRAPVDIDADDDSED